MGPIMKNIINHIVLIILLFMSCAVHAEQVTKEQIKGLDEQVQDIKKDVLILKDISSESTVIVEPGEEIPLEGTDIIFEKTVYSDVMEYQYTDVEEDSGETIDLELFENIKIEKIGDDLWAVDLESTEAAFDNMGKVLRSVVKRIRPRFRFGEGPSLTFNCKFVKRFEISRG